MSMVDRDGVQVSVARKECVDPEKAKDMAVIGYRAQGMSFRQIGVIMRVSHVAVYKRWRSIPQEARRYYAGRIKVG